MRLSSGPEHSLLTNRPVIVTQSDLLSSSSAKPLQKRGGPYRSGEVLIVQIEGRAAFGASGSNAVLAAMLRLKCGNEVEELFDEPSDVVS